MMDRWIVFWGIWRINFVRFIRVISFVKFIRLLIDINLLRGGQVDAFFE